MSEDGLEGIVKELRREIGEDLRHSGPWDRGMQCEVERSHLAGAVGTLIAKHGASMVSMHATDDRQSRGSFALHYLLSFPSKRELLMLSGETDGSFTSLTPQIYHANWYEREVMDMFGLVATGHPDPRPLVLHDGWYKGSHPLRKHIGCDDGLAPERRRYEFNVLKGDGVFEVPVGPVHAGVIEPGHFRFSAAGESILNLEVRLGYVHRGVEKCLEGAPPGRALRMTERISGDNGVAHSLAFCQAYEAGHDVPPRAQYARCILAELERVYNHLGDIAGLALDTAFAVPAADIYALREVMLGLNARITGHRMLWGAVTLGGTRDLLSEADVDDVQGTLMKVGNELRTSVERMRSSPSFMDRVDTTGIVEEKVARDLRVVGPIGRASGQDLDVRRDHPYEAYSKLNFRVPLFREGDVSARMNVRVQEVDESISLVMEALDRMPSGGGSSRPGPPRDGVHVGLVEAPSGELVHIIHTEGGKVVRHKVRDPSFCNWPAIQEAVLGDIVPDFPLINKSFSLSYAGNDL
ncbi:MAG: hydrogenase large subunit [Euryarchaeota archaeon]|nr:hydrogenase large subunit [Euryarchaeota archaeon]